MRTRIGKLYLSNFLTGLVFWYGIEKMFMGNIGINAIGIGLVTAIFLTFNFIFDIPAGIIADKWSRKGMLALSALALAICSVTLGTSMGLPQYILGYIFYGIYVVATSGTYQAITYDILREEGRAREYSKISGRAYAILLAGVGVANVASGFIAAHTSFQVPFFMTVASCLLNFLVILTIKEPKLHKSEAKERVVSQIRQVSKVLIRMRLLRTLAIIMTALSVVELFKSEFGQLYMLHYVNQPQWVGVLWAIYAFTWALGSAIAHRFQSRLTMLVVATTLPLILMALIDNGFSLVLFMIQAVASSSLLNQISTRIQDNTTSAVRASVLSVLLAAGRALAIPSSLFLGWLFAAFGAFWALRFVAVIGATMLLYWIWSVKKLDRANKSEVSSIETSEDRKMVPIPGQ